MSGSSLLSRVLHRLLVGLYRLQGWRIGGTAPAARKFVLVGAPHTSNWDFVTFLGATHDVGVRPSFIGKHSLFRWPMRRFMLDMGGIPIDRSRSANYVEQVVAEFAKRDDMALVIAPEGTRGSDGRWKSGFYHIAIGAGVPVVPAWIDPDKRIGCIGPPIALTGDFKADMKRIADFYRQAQPHNPRFREIDRGIADAPALSKNHADRLGEPT